MNKKKILALSLIVCLLATAVVGGTLAYFTDTDDATNTFTAGNVDIDLTEAVVKADERGNLVAVDKENDRNDVGDQEKPFYDYGKLYPGQTVFKDPTIENLGSENAYVAAKIIVKDGPNSDLRKVIGVPGYDNLDIHKLVSGGEVSKASTQVTGWNSLSMVYKTADSVIYQVADGANGVYTFYVFFENALVTGEEKVLFDTISVPASWDNAEMAELVDLTITVEAYATQQYGFLSCFEAITTAFPGAFNFS